MRSSRLKYHEMVELELTELKKLGVYIPDRAIEMAKDEDALYEYERDGATVSECADLLVFLAGIPKEEKS